MSDLDQLGARIRELRKARNLNQQAFAASIGIAQSSLSQIEQGLIKPSFETLELIVVRYGTSFDALLRGQAASAQAAPMARPVRQLIENPTEERIPLLDQNVLAGVLSGFADENPTEAFPNILFPGIRGGVALRVMGNSMEPTLKPGDILLCTPVDAEGFRDNRVYVVVTRDGALVKRVVDRSRTENALILKSDNRDYGTQLVALSEVVQIFQVRRRITADLSGPDALFERLNQLEQGLYDLRNAQQQFENQLGGRNKGLPSAG